MNINKFNNQKISSVINISNISYSNNRFENRINEYNDSSTKLPMISFQINYLDFVYEK